MTDWWLLSSRWVDPDVCRMMCCLPKSEFPHRFLWPVEAGCYTEALCGALQHVDTGEVLMQAYADRAAVSETLQTRCPYPC